MLVCLLCSCFFVGGIRASDCEHSWSDWSGRDGQHRRECVLCGSVVTELCEYYSIVKPSTCEEGGYTEKTCTVCNDSFRINETAPKGHAWDDGEQTKAPTCVQEGEMLYACVRCDAQKSETIAATGVHTVTEDPAVAATCASEGKTLGAHCSVCGVILIAQETIAKLSHDWDYANTTLDQPHPCKAGVETTFCKECGAKGQRTIAAREEHKRVVAIVQKEATCTENGNTQHVTCSVCGDVLFQSEVIPAIGHDWAQSIRKTATCLSDGLCDKICNHCGAVQEDIVIPATGHAPQASVPAKAATCLTAGYTAEVTCKNCRMVLSESVSVPAVGHNYKLTNTTAPTCTVDGRKTFTCLRCNASYNEKIESLTHDLYIASTTDPGCVTMGLILQRCSRCTHTLTQSVKALGHDESYLVVPPTCTEGGYTQVTCSRCDYTGQINPTDPAGHDNEVLRTVQPTCTEGGYDMLRCKVCKAEGEDNHVPANGHSWGDGVVTAPTCTAEGYTTYTCVNCPQTKTDSTVAAVGHTLYEAEPAGNGMHSGVCTACEQVVTVACSGGKLSCLEMSVCAYCNGEYGSPSGAHLFTKYTAVDKSYHRLDCANCDAIGETTEKHAFRRGAYSAAASGYAYSCRHCAYNVWGRPIGDADGNGSVADASDARSALRYSVGLDVPTAAAASAADVDKDGAVTASDARLLLRVSVGLEEGNWSVLFITENGELPN